MDKGTEEVIVTTRPHIHYCRSPNMEDFTCWWHPLDNISDGEVVTYTLTYSKEYHECPDYVTSGPNSCYFDSSHTSVWKIYCMNVTAITATRNYTSQEHCLDVAEIVQTEAPVNVTYTLTDAGGDEMGHNARLSWTYPVPSDLQFGWITLVYELQYRRVTEPDNWKVKQSLRESHVELLGLPVGDYVVRVRCRSHNYGLWSKWSATLLMNIPARALTGKLLVLILVTGVSVMALLVVGFGIIPQSKRIKACLLPAIPKPRILGINPLLLKKGHIEEINRHFSSFHSYNPPSYIEEVWDQVSMDGSFAGLQGVGGVQTEWTDREKEAPLMIPDDGTMLASGCCPAMTQTPATCCSLPTESFLPTSLAPQTGTPTSYAWPTMVSVPGTDYSMMGRSGQPNSPASKPVGVISVATGQPPHFYTCVQLMNDSGEVHLMPCLTPPPPYGKQQLSRPGSEVGVTVKEEQKKKQQLEDYLNRKGSVAGMTAKGETAEKSEVDVPLLPVSADSKAVHMCGQTCTCRHG
ncbi:prolactin receptor-like [Lampris incognitus]|uniref:prolactin receptor-like n=1 Tax=Lampris incognitus TaxID=2546036 RepID=UPI0024B4D7D9|nr:prolactin receptor-like [Lampris incognitus]